jgi:hypothetical protein
MKKGLLISFIVLLIIAPLFAFKKSRTSVLGEIIPVKPGNKWLYRTVRFNRKGEITKDTTLVRHFISDSIINGETWTKTLIGNFVRSSVKGFEVWYYHHKVPELLFKYPPIKNETYLIHSPSLKKGELYLIDRKVTVENTDTVIKIGKNSFPCIKYHISEGQSKDNDVKFSEIIYYINPEIGIIQADTYIDKDLYELYYEIKGEKFLWNREQLIDYTLK